MKKSLLMAVFMTFGCVAVSQAVVIHWAATTSLITYSSAQLVYVSQGSGATVEQILAGATVGGAVSGGGLNGSGQPSGVYERTASYASGSDIGAYYVILFDGLSAAAVSQNSLAWNSTDGEITQDLMAPYTGVFVAGLPNGTTGIGNGWTPIPEPSTFALLAVGAAVVAWRRRKRA